MKKLVKLFFVALLAVTLVACGGDNSSAKSPEKEIVGTWEINFEESILSEKTNDYIDSLVFYEDGTMEFKNVNIRDSWYTTSKDSTFIDINGTTYMYTFLTNENGDYSLIHDGQKVEVYPEYGSFTLAIDNNKLIYNTKGATIVFNKK